MADKETQRQSHRDRSAFGADVSPDERPGVPMEREPQRPLSPNVPYDHPPRQKPVRRVTHRKGLLGLTPVFSSAQRPRLLSGLLRRLAYRTSETKVRHWMTLLLADRVDVFERRLGRLLRLAGIVGAVLYGRRVLRRA